MAIDNKFKVKKISEDSLGNPYFGVVAAKNIKAGEVISGIPGKIQTMQTIYSIQVSETEHLDPEEPGRYLNHSCNPNSFMRKTNGSILLIARTDIQKEDDVTFDYATTERRVVANVKCNCNQPNCRQRVMGYEDMSAEWKEKNKDYLMPYLLQ